MQAWRETRWNASDNGGCCNCRDDNAPAGPCQRSLVSLYKREQAGWDFDLTISCGMLLPRAPFHRYESSRILKTPLINRAGPRGSPRDTSSKRILLEFMSVLAVKSYPREIAACSRPVPFDIHRFLLSFRRNTPILFDNCQFRLSNVFVNVNDGFPSSTLCKRWKKYTLAVSFLVVFAKVTSFFYVQ